MLTIFTVGKLGIDGFGGTQTIKAVFLLGAFLGIASVGQTMVILLGGIDLSIPFVVGGANVFVARLYGEGTSFVTAVALAILIALAFGSLNAFIAVKNNIHPLLVTLGTGTALLGVVQLWTGGLPTGGAPHWLSRFVAIGENTFSIPIPPLIFLWLFLAVAVIALTRMTIFGHKLFATGNAPVAAELSLVKRLPVWIGAFGISSVFSAIAGILLLGFTGTAYADVGQRYLFLSVGAVVIGGTLVTGGKGGYLGTVIGSLTLTLLTAVFSGFGFSNSLQQVIMGMVVIAMASIYGRDADVRNRV
ncbi:MAG: ABC transporter permease [Actinomycetes bacterium]